MRAPISFLWTLVLVAGVVLLHSDSVRSTQATPCEATEAWEAFGDYAGSYTNSTGNLTDIGYNRTAGGTSGQGGMNHTTSRNATIPMPNGTAVPRSTKNPQASTADFQFTAKTTAATLAIVILLLAA